MRISKIVGYETPYNVTGIVKFAGLEEKPKSNQLDRNNGTWKARDIEGLFPYEVVEI